MCHNHSHVSVNFVGEARLGSVDHMIYETRQKLTLELPDGSRLVMPPGIIFLMPYWTLEDLPASVSPAMVVRAEFMPASGNGSMPNTDTPPSKSSERS